MKTVFHGRRRLILSVAIANLLALTAGMMFTWSSPVLEKLKVLNDDNPLSSPITSTEESWIGSLLALGGIVGSYPFAYLQDKIGRKLVLLLIAIPFISAYIIAALAKVAYLFFIVRILAGVGIAGALTIVPPYIAEISEASVRGMLCGSVTVFLSLGSFLSYSLGPYLSVPLFNIIEMIFPISMAVLSYFLPESPYYLVDNDSKSKAESVLITLWGTSADRAQSELKQIEDSLMNSKANRGTFLDIFKTKATIKAFIISTVLTVLPQFCGINIFLFYAQSLFEATGSTLDSAVSSIIVSAVQGLSVCIMPLLIDRSGRRILLLVSALGMCLGDVVLGLYFYLQSKDYDMESLYWLPIVTLIFFVISFSAGFAGIPGILMAEVFPSNIKSVATSSTVSISNMVAFISLFYYIQLTDSIGTDNVFWMCSGFAAIAFLFVFFYVPETKGKTFQEIQKILHS